MQGSNLRPLACKASALPAELILLHTGSFGSACDATKLLSGQTFSIVPRRHILNMSFSQYLFYKNGDPYGIRTRVTAVKGRCLNHLTNGPVVNLAESKGFEPL